MSEAAKNYVSEVAKKVAEQLKLTNYTHEIQEFEVATQTYYGMLFPVVLKGTSPDGEKTYNVVFKIAESEENSRINGAMTFLFHTEIFTYTEMVPAYNAMNQSLSESKRYVMPEYYASYGEEYKEFVSMQNMEKMGYSRFKSGIYFDMEHMKVSLEALAQFHALSFIIEENNEALFNKIARTVMPLTEKTNSRFHGILQERLNRAISSMPGTKYVTLLENLRDKCDSHIRPLALDVKRSSISHGDMWRENILFKYENGKPTSVCIIDYQTIRIVSPAYDVLYLIISSTDAQLRKDNYEAFLQVYYSAFEKILKEKNIEASKVYSMDDLRHDLKVVSPACLIAANTALLLSNGLQEEGKMNKQAFESEAEKLKAVEAYKTVMQNIIDDFYSYGYMS